MQSISRNINTTNASNSPLIQLKQKQQTNELQARKRNAEQATDATTYSLPHTANSFSQYQLRTPLKSSQGRRLVTKAKSVDKKQSLRKHLKTFTPSCVQNHQKHQHFKSIPTAAEKEADSDELKKYSQGNLNNFQTMQQFYNYKNMYSVKDGQFCKFYGDQQSYGQNFSQAVTNATIRTLNISQGRQPQTIHWDTQWNDQRNEYSTGNRTHQSAATNKRSDLSNSLLMGLLNIKQISRQSNADKANSSTYQITRDCQRQEAVEQKMHHSMDKFFSKRQSLDKKNLKQSKKKPKDVSPLPVRNAQSFETRPVSRTFYNNQQQKKLLQSLETPYEQSELQLKTLNSQSEKARLNPPNKSMQVYQKKEQAFQKLYQDKLQELRKPSSIVRIPDLMDKESTAQSPDIRLYQERNDPFKILSNRIRTRAQMQERRFVHKNIKVLEKFFDPLRIKLRVMPISRAQLAQGKNSDFYFVEAAKLSLRGDIPYAIEMLKKGLDLKPTHLLCRFNHGALMFKLGLIEEALEDFQAISHLYPREAAGHYNLAICFVQTGRYEEAVEACDKAIEGSKGGDRELLSDSYRLKGICKFRLQGPLEATNNFMLSNKHRPSPTEKRNYHGLGASKGKELEYIYISIFIEESRLIFNDPAFQKSLLKVSKSQKCLQPYLFELKTFKRFGSEKNLEVQNQNDNSPDQNKKINQTISEKSFYSDKHLMSFESKYKGRAVSSQFNKRGKTNSKDVRAHAFDSSSLTNPVKGSNNNLRTDQTLKAPQNKDLQLDKQESAIPKVLSKELLKLKTLVSSHSKELVKDNQEARSKQLENKYYDILKGEVSSLINEGSKLRYDKIYAIDEQQLKGSTMEELQEIEKRRRLEQELAEEPKMVETERPSENESEKFLNYVMGANEIKTREVVGTNNDYGISQVAQEQERLEKMMEELKKNVIAKELEWDLQLEKEQNKLFDSAIIEDTLSRAPAEGEDAGEKQRKNQVLVQLKEALKQPNITAEDVSNILSKDLEDKNTSTTQAVYRNLKASKRLTLRQVELIKNELNMPDQQQRNTERLDKVMKDLKFFKRFDEEVRRRAYLNMELVSLPGQSVIFKQGDVGDKLYIILKGRVAVQINSAEYGNLPVVVATLKDGDQFGELSLISLDKLKDNSKQSEVNLNDNKPQQQYAKRKATCITVEQSELLALPKEFSVNLYQPSSGPAKAAPQQAQVSSSSKQTVPSSKVKATSEPDQEDQGDLNQKIKLLQSLQIFQEIDAQHLMPIACNMTPITYNFGEYIIKEGDIPKGLYIINSGQCKVASTRVADRAQSSNDFITKKLGVKKKIKDKNPLLNDFDADNTLLNEVKSLKRGFQNDRIYVDDNGEQIKGKIVYQDILLFSQLTPKNFFGGRVLLPFELYLNLRRIYFGQESLQRYYPKRVSREVVEKETESHYQLKSLLSVIADSGRVSLYILDKSDMGYLPDTVLKKVFEKIVLLKEPDRPFHVSKIEEILEGKLQWEQYKAECLENLFKEKYAEKYGEKAK